MSGKDDNNGESGNPPKAPHRFLGSLKDALMAAGRGDNGLEAANYAPRAPVAQDIRAVPARADAVPPAMVNKANAVDAETIVVPAKLGRDDSRPPAPRAGEARLGETKPNETLSDAMTRAIRGSDPRKPSAGAPRTQLVRGRVEVTRGEFHQDPVVGWLVVVGGAGLGAFRPIFEGNNTVGRGRSQRIAIDFGDETISSEEQAYIRYDSADRSFSVRAPTCRKPTSSRSTTANPPRLSLCKQWM